MTAIGIDVGGTNVRVAIVDEEGVVLEQARTETPSGDVARLATIVGELVSRYPEHLPVGMGLAGGVDESGTLVFGPNLGGMEGQQVRAPLEEAVGRPLVIANDASIAAWGEHRVGAGRGVRNVVLVTIGTGVGGGAVVGGQLLEGAHGLGAEFGHIIVADGGAACACGNTGCLEAYAAGHRFGRNGQSAGQVAAAALAGDEAARAHIGVAGRWLGVGVHSLVAALDPGIVLIGGGAGQAAYGALVGPVEETVAELLPGRGHRTPPPIARAALGDEAGVVGAALLAHARAGAAGEAAR